MATKQAPDVAVLGLGYIGLPTSAVIARSGARVLGVDVDAGVVETVNSGPIHIEELDLDTRGWPDQLALDRKPAIRLAS